MSREQDLERFAVTDIIWSTTSNGSGMTWEEAQDAGNRLYELGYRKVAS